MAQKLSSIDQLLKIQRRKPYTEDQQVHRAQPFVSRFPNLHDDPNYDELDKELESSSILLIRHANSISNNLSEQLFESKGAENIVKGEWYDIQFSPSVIDLGLSDKGIEQCLKASAYAHVINFVEVHMSPMRRTIETAYYMFKDHPNF